MLTQIKNAQARGREEVILPFSKITFSIAEILRDSGFIKGVEKKVKKIKRSELTFFNIKLKYNNGVGAISGIKLISKPSRRIYAVKDDLRPIKDGYGISIVSTSKGIMTGDEARKMGIGGEVICEVW